METPEEKRARRLAKKEEKERKRREKMGWDNEYMGYVFQNKKLYICLFGVNPIIVCHSYTNADNPFGDGKLLDTFVWHKKLEKQGLQDLATSEKKQLIKQKQESNKIELAKVIKLIMIIY